MIEIANELLKKYDVPGPRYTSYPTILHWDTSPTTEEWIESVARSLDETEREGSGAAIWVQLNPSAYAELAQRHRTGIELAGGF